MEHYIKTILRNIYLKYGDSVFKDSRRLLAFMEDVLVDYPIDKKRLTIVVNENIVSQLIYEKENDILSKAYMYVDVLKDTYEMPKTTAFELVNTFYYAVYGDEMKRQEVSDSETVREKAGDISDIERLLQEVSSEPTAEWYGENLNVLRKAATEGNKEAQFLMGKMYQGGFGTDKDTDEAKKWYLLSSSQNHGGAFNNLGVMYEEEKKKIDAIDSYWKALNNGEILAAYNLGKIYAGIAYKNSDISRKIGNYGIALNYVKKGIKINTPPPYTKLLKFLKIKYELAKYGNMICKNVISVMNRNDDTSRYTGGTDFYDEGYRLKMKADEISKMVWEKYGYELEKVEW